MTVNVENDMPLTLSLKTKATTLYLQRIERSSLVVIYKNNIDEQLCTQAIDKSARLLKSGTELCLLCSDCSLLLLCSVNSQQ